MDPVTILSGIAYALTALSAADALMTTPPENKGVATGAASGGKGNQAQDVFSQGQPAANRMNFQPVEVQRDPAFQAQLGQILASAPPAASMQMPDLSGMQRDLAGARPPLESPQPQVSSGVETIASQPQYQGQYVGGGSVTDLASPTFGQILASLGSGAGNIADALGKVAPLLGLNEQAPSRGIHTAGAAGGMGGQSVFAMPQRQTLAQILASLPRTM